MTDTPRPEIARVGPRSWVCHGCGRDIRSRAAVAAHVCARPAPGWHVGDRAVYVAGPPSWRDYIGREVVVVRVGRSLDGTRCATIRRLDTKEETAVTADERHTNIQPKESR